MNLFTVIDAAYLYVDCTQVYCAHVHCVFKPTSGSLRVHVAKPQPGTPAAPPARAVCVRVPVLTHVEAFRVGHEEA